MKRLLISLLITLAAVFACDVDDAEYARIEELGVAKDSYEVEAEAGVVWVDYYANGKGNIRFISGGDWARSEFKSFDGDGRLAVEYDDNEDFCRLARMEFRLESGRADTLLIKQKGAVAPELSSSVRNVVVYNGGSETRIPVNTNIDFAQVQKTIRYEDGSPEWIKAVSLEGGYVFLSTEDNPDPRNTRTAVLTLSFTDGWNDRLSLVFNVTQANSSNHFGEEISFGELREMGESGKAVEIEDNVYITGYVVSDRASCNVGDIPYITMTTRDYSVAARSVYIESLDGKYGLLVVTETEDDNIFQYGSQVQLLLKGTVLRRSDNPERYEISEVKSTMITRSTLVDESAIPQKKMHISELTDADIYTRVELLQCEWVVRKGSMTPVHEGYTLATGANRLSKAAMLIRDIRGESLYVYTNMTCPYRRDGSRMGYGSGSMKGVIVHEKFRSFIDGDNPDEDECGNIGRYQIRHQAKSDFGFADDFQDGFSDMICEWRYLDKGSVDPSDKTFAATYGTGRMRQSCTSYVNTGGPATQTSARGLCDYSYLGPIGDNANRPFGNHRGNVNGFGIILDDGTDYGANDPCANTDGKGQTSDDCKECILAWGNDRWWSPDGTVYSWEVFFSTRDIATEHLSMQVSLMNRSSTCRTPRYWKAEWSADGSDFVKFAEFTVPDIGVWANTLPSQALQYKPMDFPLPLEMLGRNNVTIRLSPANHVGSDGQGYANTQFAWMENCHSAMNYFAIRYNK